jgi:hypothetical protein
LIKKVAVVLSYAVLVPVVTFARSTETFERLTFSANRPEAIVVAEASAEDEGFLSSLGSALSGWFEDEPELAVMRRPASDTPEVVDFDEFSPLGIPMNDAIAKYVKHYGQGRGRGTAIRGIVRAEPVLLRAEQIFEEEGVPADLVWLAQTESGWRSVAVSPVGAGGVWQFMPATAERFGMQVSDTLDERTDFEKSTRAAAKYLKWLAKRYNGNWPLAIGAYNCGEGRMDRAVAAAGVADFWEIRRRGLLPEETCEYVPSVLANSVIGTERHRFNLSDRDAVMMTVSGRPTTPEVTAPKAPRPDTVLVAANEAKAKKKKESGGGWHQQTAGKSRTVRAK